MGLKNASIQFQRMMDDVLSPVADVADCYIDDIIVGSKVEEGEDLYAQHDKDFRRVFEVLRENKLVVDISKCRLFVPEVEFCGHMLGGGGYAALLLGNFWPSKNGKSPPPSRNCAHLWVLPTIIRAMSRILRM